MKRFIKNLSIILVVAFMLPGIVKATPVVKEAKVDRIFGGNRVETSIEVSKRAYKGEVETLFLAGYDGDADALTATFMAGQMNAPLLIADKSKISPKLLEEIKRLNPEEIIILGGDNAVSQTIEEELKANKYNTRRIRGSSRIETAVNIVEDYYKDKKVKEVFVAEYNSLVDALAIGPVAAKTGVPVLITKKDSVPDELVNFLETYDVEKVTIIGGEGTVSKRGKKALEVHTKEVGRVYGKNRIETSLNIAKKYFREPKALFVANGWNNADALIGGYFAGMQDAPIILTNKDRLTEDFTSYVRGANTSAYILGGESVIDKYVFEEVGYLIGDKNFPKPPGKPEPKPPGKPDLGYDELEAEVLRLTNIERSKNGVHLLTLDEKIGEVARLKSKDMADNDYFAHKSPTYGRSFEMMRQFGINFGYAAENIAKGYRSAESVVQGWMNSEGHRKNILNPNLNKIGIGAYANPSGAILWTQMFTD